MITSYLKLKITVLLVLVAFVFDANCVQDILYASAPQYGHHHAAAPQYDHHHAAAPQYGHIAVSKPIPVKQLPSLPYKQKVHHEKDDHEVEYKYSYAVNDEHTKDIKGQEESRKGDVVKGRYEMIDSDGYKRIVEYTADDKNGFQAVVHREKTDIVVPIPEQKVHKESDNHGQYEAYHKNTENLEYNHNIPKYNNHYKHEEEVFPSQPTNQNIQKRHTSLKSGYVAPIYEA